MAQKRLSIKDISKMSGVSVATVSRVINRSGRYSKETEERVLAVIEATSFVPNLVAKGLRMNHMNNIGIIVPDIVNEFFVTLVSEIETAFFSLGYSCLICNTGEDPGKERKHLSMMRMQNIGGLIYISGEGLNSPLEVEGIPTVLIDRLPASESAREKLTASGNCIMVESDNRQGGLLATSHLMEKGCRDILLLTDRRRLSSHQERIDGYLEAHSRAGIVFRSENIIELESMSFNCAREKLLERIDSKAGFDGVFATTDWLAMGAYVALTERGRRVPEDVKIVGYDDISIARYNAKPITTIRQQVDKIAHFAVNGMMNLIAGKNTERHCIIVPVYLVPRETA